MKKKLLAKLGVAAGCMSLLPFVALAQATACPTSGDIGFVLCKIANIINIIMPMLIAVGVVYFIWGVVQFVLANDEEAKTRGRSLMINGIIGLLVIVSIWGLVSILKKTFNLDTSIGGTVQVPCIPSPGAPC